MQEKKYIISSTSRTGKLSQVYIETLNIVIYQGNISDIRRRITLATTVSLFSQFMRLLTRG